MIELARAATEIERWPELRSTVDAYSCWEDWEAIEASLV